MFKKIIGFEDYSINSKGEVLGKFNRILKPGKNIGGYLQVVLCKDKKKYHKLIHRLVALMFKIQKIKNALIILMEIN